MTTPPPPPSIADLTNQIKQLGQSGDGKDLQLSPAAQHDYTQLIQEFRDELQRHLDRAKQIPDYANVGNLWSAVQTKDNFRSDLTGPAAFLESLGHYIDYLQQHEDAANAFFNRMQAEDHA